MERRGRPMGFLIKQINNVFEKELNERLRDTGITSSQCAVLDYLFHTSKEEVSQRDVEKNLHLKNPTVTGILKRLDEKGYILCVPNANDKRKKNIYLTEKAYDIQRRMESDRRISWVPAWMRVGGNPVRSPKRGESMGSERSRPPA